MRNKLLLLGVCALLSVLVAAVAWADKLTEENEKYWNPNPQETYSDVPEVEPNGTFAEAQPINCGDVVHANIGPTGGPTGDLDYIVFTTTVANTIITFGTDADGTTGQVNDTYIYLYNSAQTQVASNDDGGPGLYSLITYTAVTPGTYYGMVRSYSTSYIGFYKSFVNCTAPEPPPPNDRCEGAIDIPCGPIQLSGTTQWANNDYSPLAVATCTRFTAAGRDVVYRLNVQAGAHLIANYTSSADGSIYILADCSDVSSCIAGEDSTVTGGLEDFEYTFGASGTYYLILDNYGTNSGGTWTLTGDLICPTATRQTSWGGVKNIYR